MNWLQCYRHFAIGTLLTSPERPHHRPLSHLLRCLIEARCLNSAAAAIGRMPLSVGEHVACNAMF